MVKLAILMLVLVAAVAGWFAVSPQGPQPATTQAAGYGAEAGDRGFEITEAELTQQLNQSLTGLPLGSTPIGNATLQHITAELRGGKLQASGEALAGSANVPITLSVSTTAFE